MHAMTRISIALLLPALLVQATPTPAPAPSPTPTGIIYYGQPATSFRVEARPLGFDPDGNARWLLVSHFYDAQGNPTRIMANSDLDWLSRDGYVQWQTRLAYGQPAAIIKTTRDGPITVVVRCNQPKLGSITLRTNTRRWRGPRIVARSIGPHMVQIGWFPREMHDAKLVRIDGSGTRKTIALIAGPSSTYRDTGVLPGRHYRYVLYRSDRGRATTPYVATMPPAPATVVANASGKAMWLYFTSNPTDDIYFKNLNPQAIVDQAVRAGLHYVELRTAYGAYWEITPEAKPTVDAIIDGLAAHGIGTIGWTVPRDTMFDDVGATVRTAYYRTANGTPFTGVAVDLERGDEFMGGDPNGLDALWMYAKYVRQALGPTYLVVSTIEDPYLEHLNVSKYPYPQIARFSSVLQPMAYWRMMRRKPTNPAQVRILLKGSFDRTLALSQRRLPISIGGQTDAEGLNGYPPADEITASLDIAKQLGAIGECFFAWDATQPYQWDAIARYRW